MRYFATLAVTAAALLVSTILSPTASLAQTQTVSSTTATPPLWEAHLHLQKAVASPLGQFLLNKVEQEDPAALQKIAKFAEAIGLDPRTDIGEVIVFGDGFTEADATVVASLGSSTGNLEGWILAAPGYRSEDLDANTLLHSIKFDDENRRGWFALPKHSSSGKYILVGSLDQNRTIELAQRVLDGDASPLPNPLHGESILSLHVNDLSAVPLEVNENDPGSAIVKIIESIGLNVASNSDNLSLSLDVATSSAGKARQISQLLVGLKALVQLAPIDQPEAQKIAKVLDTLDVNHTEGQSNVQASLSAPYPLLEELINQIN